MLKYKIFIGIDISKKWFDACLAWEGQIASCPHIRLEQNEAGFHQLVNWIKKQLCQSDELDAYLSKKYWFVYAEHTGIYGLPLARFFEQQHIPYLFDSPLRINRSLGLKRQKDDGADAQDIARCALRRDFNQKVRPIPAQTLLKIQALLGCRARLVRYQAGLRVACKELIFATQSTIHQPIETSTTTVVKSMNKQIHLIEQQIKQLIEADNELKRLYELVTSVIGIGKIMGAYLLVYTNAFTAFDNPKQFNCFIGTAPFKYQSGTSIKRKEKVNAMANHRLKALFSMSAVTAVNHDPQIRAFFQRSLERGKEEPWIYNAIKTKLVKRVFAVVKRGTPYVKLDKHLN
ncbi:MAG: IS110 family transposase [Bacteroidota bacterium]